MRFFSLACEIRQQLLVGFAPASLSSHLLKLHPSKWLDMQVCVRECSALLLATETKSWCAWRASQVLRLYRHQRNLYSYKEIKVYVVDFVSFLSGQQAPKH